MGSVICVTKDFNTSLNISLESYAEIAHVHFIKCPYGLTSCFCLSRIFCIAVPLLFLLIFLYRLSCSIVAPLI